MLDPDEFFFTQMDPYYHFKHASLLFYCENPDHLRGTDKQERKPANSPVSFENVENVKASAVRFTRYHQAETLLTVVLGSHPHGPVVGLSKDPKIKIIDAARDISEKKIPKGMELTKNNGVPLQFAEWLSFKITGFILGADDDAICEVVDFIVLEAQFYSQNVSYNSYKHGCMVGEKSPKLEVRNELNREWIDLFAIENALTWVNCEYVRGNIKATKFGAEELNPCNDISIILFGGMIVENIKNMMLSRFRSEKITNYRLPSSMKIQSQIPSRIEIKLGHS